jgi:hypothetical protein
MAFSDSVLRPLRFLFFAPLRLCVSPSSFEASNTPLRNPVRLLSREFPREIQEIGIVPGIVAA